VDRVGSDMRRGLLVRSKVAISGVPDGYSGFCVSGFLAMVREVGSNWEFEGVGLLDGRCWGEA